MKEIEDIVHGIITCVTQQEKVTDERIKELEETLKVFIALQRIMLYCQQWRTTDLGDSMEE